MKANEMKDLKHELLELCKTNRDGSYGAQANRRHGLLAMVDQLSDLGYEPQSVHNLKPKHITALVEHWRQDDINDRSIKNRLTWLRWVSRKTNRQNIISRCNADYGLNTKPVEPSRRAFALTHDALEKVACPYVKASLMLQYAFGLRREEAIKFQPHTSILKDSIKLKASTCKGGRERTIPITSDYQLMILDRVSKLAGKGYLIPSDKSYIEQLKTYEYQTHNAGLRNIHGLRHGYAARRYTALTGLKCPLEGGPIHKMMSKKQRELVRLARLQISNELGHSRISITTIYLGRFA